MFYAMYQFTDINPKIHHINAIRNKGYKTLEAAKKAAMKFPCSFVQYKGKVICCVNH